MQVATPGQVRVARFAVCVIVFGAAVGFLVASWDELTCVGGSACSDKAGVAALVSIGCLLAIAWSLWRAWRVARTPDGELVDEPAWGLGILFAAGAVSAALLIPVARCLDGYHLDRIFRLCIQGTTRLAATDQTWIKYVVAIVGLAGGVAIVRMRRWLPARTVVAVVVWVIGIGWLLNDTFVRGL